ncbi:3-ketoacyl-ACP reductase [Proteiniclasticum sp. BAD-10]|uniref:3-ketoacyl-ACP reductase n=1 Tax=Proteiniclasticum sediminis TaxID=2804028 RepID=A0A941HRS0_9CLOT|nr:3-ketoacyl-ACP reductase [Proteiniclasticum sediminis]MBR0576898.1 3-ketoacyl-ACP reductase [Proteiniclasticum sediminis]
MKKVAIVTGGTRGIGLGIVKELAKEGYALVVLGTRPPDTYQEFQAFLQEVKPELLYVEGNLSLEADREKLVDKVLEKYGRIDLLVNNAGMAPVKRSDILEVTEENFDALYAVNTKGTFFLSQRVARAMVAQEPREGRRGILINMSSVSATVSSVNRAEYCISKAGVSMMTTLFADRLADEGVLVYEIRPGIIRSDMTSTVTEKYDRLIASGLTPIRRWGTPEDIGRAVSVLASGSLSYTTGQVIHVDGGMTIQRL